jgi:hypothetical protein
VTRAVAGNQAKRLAKLAPDRSYRVKSARIEAMTALGDRRAPSFCRLPATAEWSASPNALIAGTCPMSLRNDGPRFLATEAHR